MQINVDHRPPSQRWATIQRPSLQASDEWAASPWANPSSRAHTGMNRFGTFWERHNEEAKIIKITVQLIILHTQDSSSLAVDQCSQTFGWGRMWLWKCLDSSPSDASRRICKNLKRKLNNWELEIKDFHF